MGCSVNGRKKRAISPQHAATTACIDKCIHFFVYFKLAQAQSAVGNNKYQDRMT